jgi:hypothetical protein
MTGRPPDPRRGTAGTDIPASAQNLVFDNRNQNTPDLLSSNGETIAAAFGIGDRVVTKPTVRPVRFANRAGTVVSFGDGEVGVRLGSLASHSAAVWFLPHELESQDVGQRRTGRPCDLAIHVPCVSGNEGPQPSSGG